MKTLTVGPSVAGVEAAISSYRCARKQLLEWILNSETDRRQDQQIRLIQCLVAGLVAASDSTSIARRESAIETPIAEGLDGLQQKRGSRQCTVL